jgi:hypothetical protein
MNINEAQSHQYSDCQEKDCAVSKAFGADQNFGETKMCHRRRSGSAAESQESWIVFVPEGRFCAPTKMQRMVRIAQGGPDGDFIRQKNDSSRQLCTGSMCSAKYIAD